MSNNVNTDILEYAAMLVGEYGERSEYGTMILDALDTGDLEELQGVLMSEYQYRKQL